MKTEIHQMHGSSFIRNYKGSYVLVAKRQRPTRAIIFVHGFGGNAISTWSHFQQLVDVNPFAPLFTETDLFFYDYESTRHHISRSATTLISFVRQILDDRAAPYREVRLVGHSLGGVVIRNMVLSLTLKPTLSPYSAILLSKPPLLFAPAHRGFSHSLAAMLLIRSIPFLSLATAVWQLSRGKAYEDLQPGPPLNDLRDDTIALADKGGPAALKGRNYWGADENVVHPLDYRIDDRRAFQDEYDHFSICKPTADKPLPIEWVIDGLK